MFKYRYFYNKLDYIHKPPVTDMIVTREEDYLFSSARNYADIDHLIGIIMETSQMITY